MNTSTANALLRCELALISDPKNPAKITQKKCAILIQNGKIAEIRDSHSDTKDNFIEFKNSIVLPGIIDSQVHFRDPGAPQKEDFSSGTQSAVLGGVTAIFDMPNTSPNTSTVKRYIEKLTSVREKAYCDFALFAGATNDNSKELAEMENLEACCGIKIFMGSSTGDLLVSEDEFLEKVLRSGKKMISVHCEDEETLIKRKEIAIKAAHPRAHPDWRNVESALRATTRIVNLARKVGRKIHCLHITTAEEMLFLKDNQDVATVEILPQHLFFKAPDCYEQLGTLAQMNPPIREERHQIALKEALKNNIVKVIASDHAPHTLEEKKLPYPQSPSGLVGAQTILPLMLNFVNEGLLDLSKLCQLMSINPSQIFKIKNKGGIFVGQDADFTVVDMNQKHVFKKEEIASRAGWSPYEGMTFNGWPIATIIRGQTVMQDGKILKKIGQPLQF
jgi:dihydroorotase